MRVEDDTVFDAVHALPLRLYREGVLDGLRIDHIDGLAAPGAYLRRLRGRLAQATPERRQAGLCTEPYLIVEKILADDETLDPRWAADGTTGYDFMDQVGALLHAPAARDSLDQFWQRLTGQRDNAPEQLLTARRLMLDRHFVAERQTLVRALTRVARLDLRTRDCAAPAIDRVLTAVLTVFPVYRSYAEDGGRGTADQARLQAALADARRLLGARPGSADDRLLALLDQWLDGTPGEPQDNSAARALQSARDRALRHFQQLTPPLAAKALEDTLFYRHAPLLSRNEVGASPARFSLEPQAFHAACAARARDHPDAMLATATHDHKRGEDSRCRLAALTEDPQGWIRTADDWIEQLPTQNGMPSRSDRYQLLQSLVGAWPLDLAPGDIDTRPDTVAAFLERLAQWQQKALREAKQQSSWTSPHTAYEQAARHAIDHFLADAEGRALLREIAAYALRLAPAGLVNSLSQTLLRNTLPGVPDLYQGADLWDFSLVDPDNRRPVDYALRAALLANGPDGNADYGPGERQLDGSAAAWRSGAVKQALIRRALGLRARFPELLRHADCRPVAAQGPQADRVVAYLRRHDGQDLLVVVPRLCATAVAGYAHGDASTASTFWTDTRLLLPREAGRVFLDVLSGRRHQVGAAGELAVLPLLRDCPVALCATGV